MGSLSEGHEWWWPRCRADALEELAGECQAAGGQALAVPTDMTNEAAVAELARHAVERFGGIAVWVLETNFFGYVHGARAVLPHFRDQGHGVLNNNASAYSHVGAPRPTAYEQQVRRPRVLRGATSRSR